MFQIIIMGVMVMAIMVGILGTMGQIMVPLFQNTRRGSAQDASRRYILLE